MKHERHGGGGGGGFRPLLTLGMFCFQVNNSCTWKSDYKAIQRSSPK